MIKIDKGIPMPTGKKKPSEIAVTLQAMKVGDSFICIKTASYVYTEAKRLAIKIATRNIVEDEKRVMRVWRIK